MAVNKIPESQLPVRSVSDTDYVRIVGADGKSYRVPKTDFNGGGGGGGTIDSQLSPTSTNAVQNKAIYNAVSSLKDDLGDLSDLDTTVKTDLVSAINEVASGGGGGSSVSPYTSDPAALGTASPGSSDNYSRGDHVHPKPSAADIGAIALPVSPATGAFLVWSGSAWVAQTLSTWQGGNY